MAFTVHEQARIKHHLAYPDWSSLSNGIQLGFPAGGQPLYLVEQGFKRLTPEGENSVRIDLCECESIERELRGARTRFKVDKLGNLTLNRLEPMQLRRELSYWQKKLADDLSVFRNPAAQDSAYGGDSGINARVVN